MVNLANCGRRDPCSVGEMNQITSARPWGANNPRWSLYAYGWLSNVLEETTTMSPYYVVALVADDPSENDGDPMRDGAPSENPGAGILAVRAEAFGPRSAHKAVELTVRKGGSGLFQVLSWRQVR